MLFSLLIYHNSSPSFWPVIPRSLIFLSFSSYSIIDDCVLFQIQMSVIQTLVKTMEHALTPSPILSVNVVMVGKEKPAVFVIVIAIVPPVKTAEPAKISATLTSATVLLIGKERHVISQNYKRAVQIRAKMAEPA